MNRLAAFVVAALAAAAVGCGSDANSLDGSIKTSNDLTFDSVELRYLTDQAAYQLSYFKLLDPDDESAGFDTVAKVTFDEPEGGVVVDEAIDLKAEATNGRVERVVAAGDTFPAELEEGSVTMHTPATVGEVVDGEFAATFTNGKTLNGSFEVELAEAAF